jgi:ribosome-associated heat shock protein Hsp15
MRIDKFAWCVRWFKTRGLASTAVKGDKILLDEVIVKPSKDVTPGSEITLKKHGFFERYLVLDIPPSRVGAKLVPNYVKDITPADELEKKEFLSMARSLTREKGLGRPTKKDRRDLDSML